MLRSSALTVFARLAVDLLRARCRADPGQRVAAPTQTLTGAGHAAQVSVNTVAAVAIAVVVIVASVATTVQVYRIGDSGAQAAWGDTAAATTP